MKHSIIILLSGFFLSAALAGDTLTQVSTIGALLSGVYDGQTQLSSLKKSGDFGVGTFNGLDGEMVVINDTVFQAAPSGAVARPSDKVTTPFASVTFFHPRQPVELAAGMPMKAIEAKLDSSIATPNLYYAIRIPGRFRNVKIRSIPRQHQPYRPMRDVIKEQSVQTLDSISGTIVGFRCPAYANGISIAGYHFHFISRDRTRGGHVLGFETDSCRAEIDPLSAVRLLLPNDSAFFRADLSGFTDADVKKIER